MYCINFSRRLYANRNSPVCTAASCSASDVAVPRFGLQKEKKQMQRVDNTARFSREF